MNALVKFWNNFKSQPDVWFFYGFLLTFTLSVRKVLFFYSINGQFNEWTGIYLYLSDIFLMATFLLWGVSILRNKNVNLSTPLETRTGHKIQPHKLSIFLPNRSKPHGIFLTGSIDNIKLWLKQAIIYLPLFLVFWSFISVLWSENQNIALFRAIKLLELFLLYIYVMYQIVPSHKECSMWNILRDRHGTIIKNVFRVVMALGFIQAIIGIWQFTVQYSIGLFWLKESLISPDISGVAKIVLNGEKFIRAYGLFPHPNILGGFLLVSIITTWAYYNMFHVEHICIDYSERAERVEESNKLDPSTKLGMTILLTIQITALILTFSKSAILGLIIAFLYVLWKNKKMFHPIKDEIVSRETISSHGTSMEHLGGKAIIIAIILILSLYLAGLNFGENLEKSYSDRLGQLAIWKSITQNSLLLGIGTGSYLFHLPEMRPQIVPHETNMEQSAENKQNNREISSQAGVEHNFPNLETWQYQPIHNVFLLIWSELGIIGMGLFIWFLWKIFIWTPNVQFWIKGILAGFIFIMLFDHYLWDIQQGQIMLWLVMGILTGLAEK